MRWWRGPPMRIAMATFLFLLAVACAATAQSPPGPAPGDPGKLVIRPGGSGALPLAPGEKEPGDKAGFIIIRPNGRGVTTTQVTTRKQTATTAPSGPANGSVSVPPPGAVSKDGKELFDYWFAVGVEGQRVGYVNW